MAEPAPSWSEGQVAALLLIGSNLFGHLLPNPLGPVLAGVPWLSWLALMVAFPLLVMAPVLLAASGRVSWRAQALWPGMRLGALVSLVTATIVMGVSVLGLAIGQPQLLRIGMSWQSLRDLASVVAATTATGAALGCAGAVAGVVARSFLTPRPSGGA
jgi:hypothetical protein